jgi:polyisoprenyl-teichoic acid--peptidoglycan teichoic acid transferase
LAKSGDSGRHGKRQTGLGIALVIISVVLLAAVGVGAWFYFSFAGAVSGANAKIDTDIQKALDAAPPTTLVTVPQTATNAGEGELDAVMDILVLGSDARPGEVEGQGSSDVLMLLHIDTQQDFLSIMSIHRDLWVDIPGYGQDRINAAYYHGGPAETIATIKSSFGIDVNKYVGVGFGSFPGIIDRLGGVYVDVDRKYTDTPTWKFDLAAGYQLLDGADAMLYLRYRFDETGNYGRMLRQQRVLAGLRDQMRGWDKMLRLPGIVDTIMESATTNLSPDEMLKLAYWLAKLDGERIKQVFVIGPIEQIDGKSVAVLDKAALAAFVADFLTPPSAEPSQTAAPTPGASRPDGAVTGATLLAAAGDDAVRLALATSTTTLLSGSIIDLEKWQTAQAGIPFTLEAPTFLPDGFKYAGKVPEDAGTYGLRVGDGTQPAVRVLYRYKSTSLYLGVSATTWTEAPLAAAGTVVQDNDITYTAAGTLGKTDHVWWIKDGVLYWVSNTLTYTLSEQELLQIAESMRPVDGGAATQ